MQAAGRLRGNAVVATVMSNIGLEIALRELGIGLVRCPVGDKYVMEEMLRDNLSLGGEQSGHVIFPDFAVHRRRPRHGAQRAARDGRDGPVARGSAPATEDVPAGAAERARAREARLDDDSRGRAQAVADVEARLAGRGRLLVRYSGTEPLLRVMIEGEHQDEINAWAAEIADAVRAAIGE